MADLRQRTGGLTHATGLTLLLLIVAVPTTYQAVKAALLALTLAFVAGREVGRDRIALAPPVLHRVVLFSAAGGVLVLLGLLRGAPGALPLASVYVLWPLVYGVLIAGVARADALHRVLALLVVAALVIEVYSLSYVAYSAGVLPGFLYLPLDQGQAIGFYGGYVEFALYSITSLIFLVPFLVALLVVTPRDQPVPCGRPAVVAGVLLGLLVVLLSGRRALMLVVAASPVLAMLLRRDLPRAAARVPLRRVGLRLLAAGAVAYAVLRLTLGLSLTRLQLALVDAFKFTNAEGQARGPAQLSALLSGWSEEPLLGAGLGAVAPGLVRSLEQPWAYELSYVALLFHVGVVGGLLYAYGLYWTVRGIRRVARDGGPLAAPAVAVLTGTACFLVANGTNPYLQKFDSRWVLFLPVAVVNTWLLAGGSAQATPATSHATTAVATS
jgi:hypothetical protein